MNHDELVEKLLAAKSNDYSEKAKLVAGIAVSPRGVGQEFGLPNLGKTETQKFAIGLLQKNDLSKSSVDKLCEMVAEMPMGMTPTDKNMLAQSEKLQKEIQPMVQSAATQAQKMDMQRSHERSRGHSMSR